MFCIGEALRREVSREEFGRWIVGLWLVWKGLCDEKHKGVVFQGFEVLRRLEILIENYDKAKEQTSLYEKVLPREGSLRWERPKRGRFRLDVDYAMDEQSSRGGAGAILRDHENKIMFAVAKSICKSRTTLHGELKAVMHGICQSIEEGLSPVEVFTDSLLAVHIIEEGNEEDSVLYEELFDFFSMVKELNVIAVRHVRREANMVAHELARKARFLDSTAVWRENWPSWLMDTVMSDVV